MKKISVLILAILMLAMSLCSCSGNTSPDASGDSTVSAPDAGASEEKGDSAPVSTSLPATFEVAVTDPHYQIATPDWDAESYGCGFALNEKGNKAYAIVVVCGSDAEEAPLTEVFSALYNDTFNGILMQNYRARYAEFTPATTEVKLADGSAALRFADTRPADDCGTAMSCPVYGYGFSHDGVPLIVAYIVMDESAADDAKRAEMQGYVDEMVNTVTTVQ